VKFCHLGATATTEGDLTDLALAKGNQRDLGGHKERTEEDEEDD
jgi:hypothetical protein